MCKDPPPLKAARMVCGCLELAGPWGMGCQVDAPPSFDTPFTTLEWKVYFEFLIGPERTQANQDDEEAPQVQGGGEGSRLLSVTVLEASGGRG